jgi:hypothetical protein
VFKPSSLFLLVAGLTLSGCAMFRAPPAQRIEPMANSPEEPLEKPRPPAHEPSAPSTTAARSALGGPPVVESRALPRESLPAEPVRDKPSLSYSSSPYGVDPIPSLPATPEPTEPVPPESPPPAAAPAPYPETSPDGMATPPPESPAFTPPPEPKIFSQSAPPAVLALQTDIEGHIKSGSYADAAGSLERAIRIQPKNPELWHVLAEVRLKQNQPGLAEDLAKKSNLLAKNNAELVRSNWNLIAEARRLKGDTSGVMEALDKARW